MLMSHDFFHPVKMDKKLRREKQKIKEAEKMVREVIIFRSDIYRQVHVHVYNFMCISIYIHAYVSAHSQIHLCTLTHSRTHSHTLTHSLTHSLPTQERDEELREQIKKLSKLVMWLILFEMSALPCFLLAWNLQIYDKTN